MVEKNLLNGSLKYEPILASGQMSCNLILNRFPIPAVQHYSLYPFQSNSLPVLATSEIQKQLGDGESPLKALLSTETGLSPDSILDYDISVADTQPASLGGLHSEFIFASRLDNQVACFTGLKVQ